MKTAIVTDSNCGISKKEADKLGLFIIPMPVCINNTFYYEGIDLDQKTFFDCLSRHEKIHTSQPSPADLMATWESVLRNGYDELLYIPMSSGLSGSYCTARQMAEEYSGKVYVADVRRVSVTQRHAVQDAKIDAYEKVRGLKKCEKKLLNVMQERTSHFKSLGYDIRLGIASSFLNETDLSDWYKQAEEVFPNEELLYDPLTCSISSHVGPNAFGMGLSVKITI